MSLVSKKYSHFLLNYLKYKNFLKLDTIEKALKGSNLKYFCDEYNGFFLEKNDSWYHIMRINTYNYLVT